LFLVSTIAPLRLVLEGAEQFELALGIDNSFDCGRTKRTDQLVFEVIDANEEPEPLHVGTSQARPDPGPFERAFEDALLARVAEARKPHSGPMRTKSIEVFSDVRGTPHCNDGDSYGIEIPTSTLGERIERQFIAYPFNEQHCTANSIRHP
jgi:hypothetical protein